MTALAIIDPFTPYAQKVLSRAYKIARKRRSFFVGTEHYLLALLELKNKEDVGLSYDGVTAWLEVTARISLTKLHEDAEEICAKTGGNPLKKLSTTQSLYSPSFARSLELTHALTNEAGSKHVLMGILLADSIDNIQNAASNIIKANTPSTLGKSVLEMLLSSLSINDENFELLPQRMAHQFGIIWRKSIKSAGKKRPSCSQIKTNNNVKNNNYSSFVPNTHWVLPNVLCGLTPGRMSKDELKVMVEDCEINIFVCLQTSYKEYVDKDYARVLSEEVYRWSPPPFDIKFLHCPIPDFGILDDNSLVALVAELQALITSKDGNNIYIHCFGGHGRTGTVCVNLLSAIEDIGPSEALETLCNRHYYRVDKKGHRCRYCAFSYGKLEDKEQMKQAQRLKGGVRRPR